MLVSVFREKEIRIEKDLSGINYRYMDGKLKNRKHCSGYCNLQMHRGFMDDKQIEQHKCYEKECDFFFTTVDEICSEIKAKKKRDKQERKRNERDAEVILEQCNVIGEGFEGLKATSVKREKGVWVIEYITICSVDLDSFERKVSEVVGDFQIRRKECDFDTAERIYLAN